MDVTEHLRQAGYCAKSFRCFNLFKHNSNHILKKKKSISCVYSEDQALFLHSGMKRSVFIPITKKCNPKECSNYHTIADISHASKVMLKILQARLQQYMNRELPDVQVGFRKAQGPEIKFPTSIG